MFFQSLLPSFNLNNAGGGGGGAAVGGAAGGNHNVEQQQNVIANVEQAAARVDQVNDEVAEVDRHLQALNMNLENAAAEGKF